jgi:hypothetical protein
MIKDEVGKIMGNMPGLPDLGRVGTHSHIKPVSKDDIEKATRNPVRIRLYVCAVCGKPGGTLIKVKEDREKWQVWYAHQWCWERARGTGSQRP